MPGLCNHWSSSMVRVVPSCVVFTPVCFISPACVSLYLCDFVSCSMDWSIWLHNNCAWKRIIPITLLVGQYSNLKIVLSQASWQRVMLLPSRSALQPLPSFNLLCRCKPSTRHQFFLFQVYISCFTSANISPSHIACVCWINIRGYCRPMRRWWR